MSKKIKNMKWKSVALEGLSSAVTDNLEGFGGLEVCTDYALDVNNKKTKKNKPKKKRKSSDNILDKPEVVCKKTKLSNGFVVEDCNTMTPSNTNPTDSISPEVIKKPVQSKIKPKKEEKQPKKPVQDQNLKTDNKTKKQIEKKLKLGENKAEAEDILTAEDMLTWAEFKLPDEILKALAELKFRQPTKIQQLSLPAALHGRRDILGAAETGSGKTLAFGLPILTGIMRLKEKAKLKGLDVYEIPYRKAPGKKKIQEENNDQNNKGRSEKNNKEIKKNNKKNKKKSQNNKPKESSEDGYSSGDESDNEIGDTKMVDKESNKTQNQDSDDEFIEEIDVPVRKRSDSSTDEGNDSDNDDEYVHLSEMLDSDDLADSSDEENDFVDDLDDGEDQADDEVDDDKILEAVEGSDEETDSQNEVDENLEGIGCVKVEDDIQLPGTMMVKTGKPLYALILTPTRELAMQVSRHLIAVAKYTGIRVATIVGGMAAVKQERVLRSGPEIVVATPGRLWELHTQGEPHLQQLQRVKFLAIDETDRMIERGHFEELTPLLERLNADEVGRSARQNFVFSATLTMVHDLPTHMKGKKVTKRGKILNRKIQKMTPEQKVKRLVTMVGMTDPKVVDITTQNLGTAESLTECRIACSFDHKDAYLYYVLRRHPGRTIVFCNSIGCVRRLAQLFTLLKCRPLPLHASMPQRQRLKNLERFRDDPRGVLVATDVAARGLDIPDVDHVIHYQVPRTAENYVHRSGRTARATKEGLTILMMEPAEAFNYTKLCRTLNKTAELPSFPVSESSLAPIRELMSHARGIDTLMLKRRKQAQAAGWREKVANEMDMIVDDDDVPFKEIDASLDKALKVKRRQLDAMLARPVFPRGFSFKYPTLNEPDALELKQEDALQVMKKAIATGELKKQKRKSKNAPLLKLQKTFMKKNL